MKEDTSVMTGAELLEGELTVPDVNITINGNVENVNITVNHFTDDKDKE